MSALGDSCAWWPRVLSTRLSTQWARLAENPWIGHFQQRSAMQGNRSSNGGFLLLPLGGLGGHEPSTSVQRQLMAKRFWLFGKRVAQ